MNRRRTIVLPVVAAGGVVAAAIAAGVVAGSGDEEPASAAASTAPADPRALDVVVLVPDSDRAAQDRELVTEAVGMWQSGIESIADEPGLGWLRDAPIHVTAQPLGDVASYTLHDPEVVIIAATPPGGTADTPVTRLDLVDADGATCAGFDDPFAFWTWSTRPGFRSHHSLPEGTVVEACGDAPGGQVCVAANAALTATGSMEQVLETYRLVSDEFGHCLSRGDDYTVPAAG